MYYIYEIRNKINNKTYIGQRKCPEDKTPETDSYMGSGSYLKKAKDKYGIENFEKRIVISNIDSKKEIDKLEIEYIKKYREEGKAEYNIADGGTGGNTGEEVNKKISNTLKGTHLSEETKRKIGLGNKGKIISEEHKRRISAKNKGFKWSEKQKENHSERIKLAMNRPEVKLLISQKTKDALSREDVHNKLIESHKLAMNRPEVKLKLSESHKGCAITDEQKIKISESLKGKNNWSKGSHWYNNGEINICSKECPIGFIKGRIKK